MSNPSLAVTLLGPPQFTINGQPVTGFPSSKVTALGYYLAATGSEQTRESLAGLLWPDYDSAQAKKNLRGAIYHLRSRLDGYLTITRQTVGFADDGSVIVDSRRFQHLFDQAAARAEEPAASATLLEEAAALFRDDFLAGFYTENAEPFDEWQRAERERHRQMALQAYSTLVQHAIQEGNTLAGIRHATQLLALDSLHEGGHRSLMWLLAQDNRPSAALAQFELCKQLLWDELGVEPDDETTALATRIREGELSGLRFAQTPLPRRRLHNLPAELTPFIGREAEARQVRRAVTGAETRLVAITGPGGAGKSRLAIHAGSTLAHELEAHAPERANGNEAASPSDRGLDAIVDGIYFVRLSAVEPGADANVRIYAAIAEALQIEVGGGENLVSRVDQVLAERRLLLILDNFEQIRQQAELLVTLLRQGPGLRLLVTSRVHLNIRGEQVISLDGLPLPPANDSEAIRANAAAQLFIASARSASPGFAPEETELAAIARTCRLVQGLPLAIELAASWAPLLSCQEIAQEITRSLDFLSSNMPDLPERHHSLRAVFDHSWRLLTAGERRALQRLTCFRSSFTRHAAAAVAGASLPELLALLEKSLIRRSEAEEAQGTRFALPELIRQYAAERLDAAGDVAQTMAASLQFYNGQMALLSGELRSGKQVHALDQIAAEIENIRAAHEWAVEHHAAKPLICGNFFAASCDALFDFLDIRGRFQEGVYLFGKAADALSHCPLPDDHPLLETKLRARQAWFLFHVGRHDESRALFRSCLGEAEQGDNPSELLFVLNYLSAVSHHMGDDADARRHLATAAAIEQSHLDDHAAGITANIAAMVAFAAGELDEARRQCERALHTKRQVHDQRGRTYALNYLGRVYQLQCELDQARRAFAESLDIAEALEDPRAVATAQQYLGSVALASGQLAGAQRQYQIALATFRRIGSLIETSLVLSQLGRIAQAQQRFTDAVDLHQEALQIALEIHAAPEMATALLGISSLLVSLGHADEASAILAVVLNHPNLDPEQRAMGAGLAGMLGDAPVPLRDSTVDVETLDALADETAIRLTTLARQL